jgi:hypothetical protein
MHYTGLERGTRYRVRVVYAQQEGRSVRLTAGKDHEVHGWLMEAFKPLEFDVPAPATADGELMLTWTQEAGGGGAGRGCQVAEVWLLKTPAGK